MDDREKRLLMALACMARQYLQRRDGQLDSDAMQAGELAIEALAEYGLVEANLTGRHLGRWTEAGAQLLGHRGG